MNSAAAARLLDLNRAFYDSFAGQFSATRQRLQPGVTRVLGTIAADESVLDLGCGNGNFLLALAGTGHRGRRLGADFSVPLLDQAGSAPGTEFIPLDLAQLPSHAQRLSGDWDFVTMFAALHHIPSERLRLNVLRTVRALLKPGGLFILSNWQFMMSEKLRSRLQPWESAGLSETDVDEGDALLDWRGGGSGLRYVHQFSAQELKGLAQRCGMQVTETFLSDGEGGRLGLYQVWKSVLP